MKPNLPFLVIVNATVCCLVMVTSSRADKGDRFVLNTHGRFYIDAVRYMNQGMDLRDKGDLHGAMQCLDKAIQIDKGIWPAYVDRAGIFVTQHKLDLALRDCNTAAHLRPDFYMTFIVRASVYSELGRCREGLADLDRVISFNGPSGTAAIAFGERARLRLKCRDASVHDPKLAVADAKKACDLVAWNKAKYIGLLGAAYAASGDMESATRYEQQAIKTGKYNPDELRAAQERLAKYEQQKKQ